MKLIPTNLDDLVAYQWTVALWSWACKQDWRLPFVGVLLTINVIYICLSWINGRQVLSMWGDGGGLPYPPEAQYLELVGVLTLGVAGFVSFFLSCQTLVKRVRISQTGVTLLCSAQFILALVYTYCLFAMHSFGFFILSEWGRFPELLLTSYALFIASLLLVGLEHYFRTRRNREIWPAAALHHQALTLLLLILTYHATLGWLVDLIL